VDPAGPQELATVHLRVGNPERGVQPGCLGDLEPDRLARLALDHRGPLLDAPGGEDIVDPGADKVAAAQFAVDGHVEQRKVTGVACHLEADPDGPDMPR